MKYTVDLDKKIITYDDKLPLIQRNALKKTFTPLGYAFINSDETRTPPGIREQMEEANSFAYNKFNLKDIETALEELFYSKKHSEQKKREFKLYNGSALAYEMFNKAIKKEVARQGFIKKK